MKYFKKRYKPKGRIPSTIFAFLCFLLIIVLLYGQPFFTNLSKHFTQMQYTASAPEGTTLAVTYIDVGQGNCILIESDGHYMLIDGGDNKHSSFVVSYLKQHNITNLDYVLISHYDSDHLSGVIGVLYNFPVTTLLTPDYESDTKLYASYEKCIAKQNITPAHPTTKDSFTLGNAEFTVVCPDNYEFEEENNFSLGIRMTDGSHSFLFLGDAQSKSEAAMLKSDMELSADVYMVSHHGSKSSSTEKFLQTINPSYAVISVGADNDYGHPSSDTLSRLKSHHVKILRTDLNGTITAYSTPDGIQWNTEKQNNTNE